MKAAVLDILLQEGEGVMLEYKEGISGSFARELVAFANTAGGRILLGVRDNGTVKGIADTNVLRARIQDIARNCDPPVQILLQHIGMVTVVTVRESDAKPVQCSDGFFLRQGAVTQKLSREEIRDMFRQGGAVRFDLSPCPAFRYPEDFDSIKFREWLQKSSISQRSQVEDIRPIHEASEQDTRHVPDMHPTCTAHVPDMYPACTPQVIAILNLAEGEAKTRVVLQEVAKIKNREHFYQHYLQPLLSAGLLERTVPDKPRSPKQRYVTTAAGRAMIEKSDKES